MAEIKTINENAEEISGQAEEFEGEVKVASLLCEEVKNSIIKQYNVITDLEEGCDEIHVLQDIENYHPTRRLKNRRERRKAARVQSIAKQIKLLSMDSISYAIKGATKEKLRRMSTEKEE